MLNSVSNYLYDRRSKFAHTAGAAGGLYWVSQYATARIADMRDGVLEQRVAREKYVLVGSPPRRLPSSSSLIPRSMRRRFQQNMQDISFTIMTYMPLLSKNILDEMDVEALTAELQSLSRTAEIRRSSQAAPGQEQAVLPPPPPPQVSPRPESLDSSVELIRSSDARSETSSASFLSISPRPEVTQLAESIAELPPPPPYAPRSLEASSRPLELQGSSSEASAHLVESKARSDSVVSSSVVSSNGDSIVVSAKWLGATGISDVSYLGRLICLPLSKPPRRGARQSFGERSKCLVRPFFLHFLRRVLNRSFDQP